MSLLRSLLMVVVLFAFYSMACQGSQPPRRAAANQNEAVANQKPENGQQGNNVQKMPTEEEKKQKEFEVLFKKIKADLEDRVNNNKNALNKKELMDKFKMDDAKIKDFEARAKKLPNGEGDKVLTNAKWTPNV